MSSLRPVLTLSAVLSAGITSAQDLVIDEIIVTATRRAENLRDVPIAVSALTGDAIVEAGVKDIRDIAGQIPGLSIKSRGDTEASVFIRGIGSQAPGIGADPAVGIYIDGLYAARGTNATAAFFDIVRVEVIKGPQGTLFGRNASAGAISLITNKPEIGKNYGSALVGFGNEGQQKYEFIYNADVSDRVAFRIGARHDRRDGLYRNSLNGDELNGRENSNVRVALHYEGSDSWASDFSYEYTESSSKAAFVGDPNFYDDDVPLQDVPADQDLESSRLNWTNSWDLRDNLILTSITGYFDLDVNVTPVDADTLEIPLLTFEEPQTAKMFSQEFRLNGSSGSMDWFIGGSYIEEDLTFRNSLVVDEFIAAAFLGQNALDVGNMNACDGGIDFDGTGDVAFPVCLAPAIETPSGKNKTTSRAVYGDVTWQM
ncbi:MAG: TonB-dependent receptor, partial [Woeseiaceae bacterium]